MPRGRPKGALNKSTKDIKALAQRYTPRALQTLEQVMLKSDSDAARVAAAKEFLDRAYGKSAQSVEHKGHLTHDIGSLSDAQLAAIIAGERGGRDAETPNDKAGLH